MHDLDRVQADFEMPDESFEMDFGEPKVDALPESEAALDDGEEMELAAELLDVSSEHELDQFLGKWLRKVGQKAKGALTTGAGRALGGVLKGAIKKVLPGVAGAAGNYLLPGIGGPLGTKAASMAGSLLGLELEGLSPEDQEYETARQMVRLGTAAMQQAAGAADGDPRDVATRALSAAASHYAPGLLQRVGAAPGASNHRRSHGTWRRVGNRIILEGI